MKVLVFLIAIVMFAGFAFASPPELADEVIPSEVIWGVSKAEEKLIIETMAPIYFTQQGDFVGVEVVKF